jgi:hypothetical protein
MGLAPPQFLKRERRGEEKELLAAHPPEMMREQHGQE